jgi:hypothetical protein
MGVIAGALVMLFGVVWTLPGLDISHGGGMTDWPGDPRGGSGC